ncbi:AlbA family DNA-binding domain-containing protein [Micromonospora matsumotoense]|uniref:AlbA family DNA-binding domain-containing protein n=1 Tax=Micromonospora matsumotoense TaxID=121616 RepID=UPI003D90B6BF
MAVIVEPVVSEEKLRSLLNEGGEQECLDFKATSDLSVTYDLVALVKDIAAMLSNELGGYIVIGAHDNGVPAPGLTARHLQLFDESRVRAKIVKYLPEPFDFSVARHTIDGCPMVLLYVSASPKGFHIFSRNGEYELDDPQAKGGKRKGFEFRRGEVFVRRGTSSVVWEPADRERLIGAIVARHKDQWRTEYRDEITAMINVRFSAHNLQQLPAAAMTWRLDPDAFDELTLELLRRQDLIPLRRALLQSVADAAAIPDLPDFDTLLHRVTSVAAQALTYQEQPWFIEAVQALTQIFERPGPPTDPASTLERRLLVAAHGYALGALAVRMRNWPAVRHISDRQIRGAEFNYYRNWFRHTIVNASRARMIDDRNPDIIGRARNIVRETAALHADLPAEHDEILNSLCQFDALTGIVFLADPAGSGSPSYWPHFALYDHRRTEPIFVDLSTDQAIRQQIAGHDNDRVVASAMVEIDGMARHAGFRYDGWEGFAYTNNREVLDFLSRHATNATAG